MQMSFFACQKTWKLAPTRIHLHACTVCSLSYRLQFTVCTSFFTMHNNIAHAPMHRFYVFHTINMPDSKNGARFTSVILVRALLTYIGSLLSNFLSPTYIYTYSYCFYSVCYSIALTIGKTPANPRDWIML